MMGPETGAWSLTAGLAVNLEGGTTRWRGTVALVQPDRFLVSCRAGDVVAGALDEGQLRVTVLIGNARYCFASKLLSAVKDEAGDLLLALRSPNQVERVQLRDNVRAEASLAVSFRLPGEKRWQEGASLDISAGGMRLASLRNLPEGDRVEVRLSLLGETTLQLKARVVRSWLNDPRSLLPYHAALAFEGLSEREEDTLVAFVFHRIRQQRRLLLDSEGV